MTLIPKEINRIYITGHKHPDTDSVCSAIAYARLKQIQGADAVACRLGELNRETTYVLNKFKVAEPQILDDARMMLKEIEIDSPLTILPDTTIYEAWQLMNATGRQALLVTDEDAHLIGMITNSNLSSVAMGDTAKSIELLQKTPVEYIVKTIKGELIYKPEVTRLNGKVSIVAVAEHKLDRYELSDRTVIVGNDSEAMIQAIDKDAACLVTVWCEEIPPEVIEHAKNKGCVIIKSGHGTLNTSRYIYYSTPVNLIMTKNLITFNKSEYVDDVSNKIIKTRFRAYPVVDDKNRVIGLVSRFHLLNAKRKRIVLVDHNEVSQAVEGVLEADLLEIIDHHRIGDIQTNKPITFRNQLVGSTATIIASLYEEARLIPEKAIAGLLCSAIVSDTLNFKSPTTTPTDFYTAQHLAQIANLNIADLAKEIFTFGAAMADKSMEQIIEHDIKEFNINNTRLMVGQMSLYDISQLDPLKEELVKAMDEYAQRKHLDLLLVLFTSLQQNGSAMLYAGKEKWIAVDAYPGIDNVNLKIFEDIVSRKKQVIPRLSAVIQENKL
jgi:manganese-dependent inorganic pyrophosphatase